MNPDRIDTHDTHTHTHAHARASQQYTCARFQMLSCVVGSTTQQRQQRRRRHSRTPSTHRRRLITVADADSASVEGCSVTVRPQNYPHRVRVDANGPVKFGE